jgi:hypothetical protein
MFNYNQQGAGETSSTWRNLTKCAFLPQLCVTFSDFFLHA